MKCWSDMSKRSDITEKKTTYFLMPAFICVENTRSLFSLLVSTHRKFRARNSHCRIIAQEIGTATTSIVCCFKHGIECSAKLDMTVDFSFLVAFITLTWIRAYFDFYITYVRVYGLFRGLLFRVGQTQEKQNAR